MGLPLPQRHLHIHGKVLIQTVQENSDRITYYMIAESMERHYYSNILLLLTYFELYIRLD